MRMHFWRSWVRKMLFGRVTRPIRRTVPRARLRMDFLEDRVVPTVYSPGGAGSYGVLSEPSPFTVGAQDTVQIDIGAAVGGINTPGQTYDQISLAAPAGKATFGGTLQVSVPSGFNPTAGTQYRIVTGASSTAGTFSQLTFPTLTNGDKFVPVFTTDGLSLVVAAPSRPVPGIQFRLPTTATSTITTTLDSFLGATRTTDTLSGDFNILGQTITGSYTLGVGTLNGSPALSAGATGFTASIAGGLATLGGGSASLFVTSAGVVGSATGTVSLQSPSSTASFGGTFGLAVNTTGTSFAGGTVNGVTLPAVAAGSGGVSYFRLSGTGASLTVGSQAVTGDFVLENGTLTNGTSVVHVGAANVSAKLGSAGTYVQLTGGSGAADILPTGVAAQFGGGVALVGASSDLTLNVPSNTNNAFNVALNTTGVAVKDSFTVSDGRSVGLDFTATGTANVVKFGGALNLSVANSVSVNGTFDFQYAAATGSVPATLLAGVSVGNAFFGASSGSDMTGLSIGAGQLGLEVLAAQGSTPAGYALNASLGNVSLAGVSGLTLGGTAISVQKNTTGGAVGQTIDGIPITFTASQGNYSQIAGTLSGTLQSAAGTTAAISGNFGFSKSAVTSGTTTTTTISVTANNVNAFYGTNYGAANETGVRVSNGLLGLRILKSINSASTTPIPSTFALEAAGSMLAELPGTTAFSSPPQGTLEFRTNDTGANQSFNLTDASGNPVTYTVPANTTLYVGGSLQLGIAGQSLAGSYAIGVGPYNGGIALSAAITNFTASISGGEASLTGGNASLLITSAGIVGSASGSVAIASSSATLSGTFGLAINTTGADFPQTTVNGVTVAAVPGGTAGRPYFRLSGTGASLTVGSQSVSGDFVLESGSLINGGTTIPTVHVGAANVSAQLGSASTYVQLTGGSGAADILPTGVAAQFDGGVALVGASSDLTLSGAFNVALNNTGVAVKDSFTVSDGRSVGLDFTATGTANTAKFGGALNLAVANSVNVNGTFDFQYAAATSSTPATLLAGVTVCNAFFGVASGTDMTGLSISGGQFGLEVLAAQGSTPAGYALTATTGTVSLVGVNGLALSGSLTIQKNTTGGAVSQTIDGIPITFTAGQGNISQVGGSLSGTIQTPTGTTVALAGNFGFNENSVTAGTVTTTTLQVSASGITAFFGTGYQTADETGVKITNGLAGLRIIKSINSATPTSNAPSTYALEVAGTVAIELPGVTALTSTPEGTLEVRTNNTGANQTFTLTDSSGNATNYTVPQGTVLYVGGNLQFGLNGFDVSGGLSFAKVVTNPTPTSTLTKLLIGGSNITAGVTVGGVGVHLVNGSFGLAVYKIIDTSLTVQAPATYALDALGTASIQGLPISIGGSDQLELKLNTTGGAVNETIPVTGSTPVTLSFQATDPVRQFIGNNLAFGVPGVFNISGNLSVTPGATPTSPTTLSISSPVLSVYDNGQKALTIGNANTSATFTLGGTDSAGHPLGLVVTSFAVDGFNFTPPSTSSGGSGSGGGSSTAPTVEPVPSDTSAGKKIGPLTLTGAPRISLHNFSLSPISNGSATLSAEVDITIPDAKLTLGTKASVDANNITGSFNFSLPLTASAPFVAAPPTGSWAGLTIGTLTVSLGDPDPTKAPLAIVAANLGIDPTATGTQNLIDVGTATATVNAGPISASAGASNFGIRSDGTFVAEPNFGITFSIDSTKLGLPKFLPLSGNASVAVTWADFNDDPGNFLLTTSIDAMMHIGTTAIDVSVQNLTLSVSNSAVTFVSIGSVGAQVNATLFGAGFQGAFIGGLARFNAAGQVLPDSDTNPGDIAQSVFYLALDGTLQIPNVAALTLRIGFSDSGPLDVYLQAHSPTGFPLGDTTLVLNDIYGTIDFDSNSFPTVTDPSQLASPAFASKSADPLSLTDWTNSLKQQLERQNAGSSGYLFDLPVANYAADVSALNAGGALQDTGLLGDFFTMGLNLNATPTNPGATVTVLDPGNEWSISEGMTTYIVDNVNSSLRVSQVLGTLAGADAASFNAGTLTSAIVGEFSTAGVSLSSAATVATLAPGIWRITDGANQYDVSTHGAALAFTKYVSATSALNLGVIRIEAGATVYDEVLPESVLNAQADVIIETDGKFVIGAQVNLLNTVHAKGVFYADLSQVTNGQATLAMLVDAELPGDVADLRQYGYATISGGSTGATIAISGGAQLTTPVESVELNGDLTLTFSSSQFTVDAFASLSLSGVIPVQNAVSAGAFFTIDSTGIWGAASVQAQTPPILDKAGLDANLNGFFDLNTTGTEHAVSLRTSATDPTARTTTDVLPNSFSLTTTGALHFEPAGVDLLDVTGSLYVQITNAGLDLFVEGTTPASVFGTSFVGGALIINSDGVAGQLSQVLTSRPVFNAVFNGNESLDLDINTTSKDQSYDLPGNLTAWLNANVTDPVLVADLGKIVQNGRVFVPAGAPHADGSTGAAGAYLELVGSANLSIVSDVNFSASFALSITGAGGAAAHFEFLGSANIAGFAKVGVYGAMDISSAGLVVLAQVDGDLKLGVLTFHGNAELEINTTSNAVVGTQPNTGSTYNLAANSEGFSITGQLELLNSFTIQGTFAVLDTPQNFSVHIAGGMQVFNAITVNVNADGLIDKSSGGLLLYADANASVGDNAMDNLNLVLGANATFHVELDTLKAGAQTTDTIAGHTLTRGTALVDVSLGLNLFDVITLSGDAKFQVSQGVFSVQVSMTGSFAHFVSLSASGFFSSEGEFDVVIEGSVKLGGHGFGLFGHALIEVSYLDDNGTQPHGHGGKHISVHGEVDAEIKGFGITLVGLALDVQYNGTTQELSVTASVTVIATFTVHFNIGFLKSTPDTPPTLASEGSDGVLYLNVGDRASLRGGSFTTGDEDYSISQDGTYVYVDAFGYEELFPVANTHSIQANFDDGNADSLTLDSTVVIPLLVDMNGNGSTFVNLSGFIPTLQSSGQPSSVTLTGSGSTANSVFDPLLDITIGNNSTLTIADNQPSTSPGRMTLAAGDNSTVDARQSGGPVNTAVGSGSTALGSAYADILSDTGSGTAATSLYLYGAGGTADGNVQNSGATDDIYANRISSGSATIVTGVGTNNVYTGTGSSTTTVTALAGSGTIHGASGNVITTVKNGNYSVSGGAGYNQLNIDPDGGTTTTLTPGFLDGTAYSNQSAVTVNLSSGDTLNASNFAGPLTIATAGNAAVNLTNFTQAPTLNLHGGGNAVTVKNYLNPGTPLVVADGDSGVSGNSLTVDESGRLESLVGTLDTSKVRINGHGDVYYSGFNGINSLTVDLGQGGDQFTVQGINSNVSSATINPNGASSTVVLSQLTLPSNTHLQVNGRSGASGNPSDTLDVVEASTPAPLTNVSYSAGELIVDISQTPATTGSTVNRWTADATDAEVLYNGSEIISSAGTSNLKIQGSGSQNLTVENDAGNSSLTANTKITSSQVSLVENPNVLSYNSSLTGITANDPLQPDSSVTSVGQYVASPDGNYFYQLQYSQNQGPVIATYVNDPNFGFVLLGYTSLPDSTGSLVVSPNGQFLYSVSPSQINVFSRNTGTGRLALVQTVSNGTLGDMGTGSSPKIAISPDGLNIYAVDQSYQIVNIFLGANGLFSFATSQNVIENFNTTTANYASALAGISSFALVATGLTVTPNGTVYVSANLISFLSVFTPYPAFLNLPGGTYSVTAQHCAEVIPLFRQSNGSIASTLSALLSTPILEQSPGLSLNSVIYYTQGSNTLSGLAVNITDVSSSPDGNNLYVSFGANFANGGIRAAMMTLNIGSNGVPTNLGNLNILNPTGSSSNFNSIFDVNTQAIQISPAGAYGYTYYENGTGNGSAGIAIYQRNSNTGQLFSYGSYTNGANNTYADAGDKLLVTNNLVLDSGVSSNAHAVYTRIGNGYLANNGTPTIVPLSGTMGNAVGISQLTSPVTGAQGDAAFGGGFVQYSSLIYALDPQLNALVTLVHGNNGQLQFLNAQFGLFTPALQGASSLAISTDHKYLYVASPTQGTISIFRIDTSASFSGDPQAIWKGTPIYWESVSLAGTNQLAVVGNTLYATTSAAGSGLYSVASYSIAGDGSLNYVQSTLPEYAPTPQSLTPVTVSGNLHLFTTDSAGIRDNSFAFQTLLSGAGAAAYVPAFGYTNYGNAGGYLFVAQPQSAAVDVYAINQSGYISLINTFQNGVNGVTGLAGISSLTVSTDYGTNGYSVYGVSTTDNSLVAFTRDGNGNWTLISRLTQGFAGVNGLSSPNAVLFDNPGIQYPGVANQVIVTSAGSNPGIASFNVQLNAQPPTSYAVQYSGVSDLQYQSNQSAENVSAFDASSTELDINLTGSGKTNVALLGTNAGALTNVNIAGSAKVVVDSTGAGSQTNLNGGSGDDTFVVNGNRLGSGSAITANGNGNATSSPGDTLVVQGATAPFNPTDGTASTTSGIGVVYHGIETTSNPSISLANLNTLTITEGDTLNLSAPAATGGTSPLTYAWDLSGSGTFGDASGTNPSVPWTTLQSLGINGAGNYPIAVQVTDANGNSYIASGTLHVNAYAVTATASGSGTATVGSVYSISLNSVSPYQPVTGWSVNWGDGTSSTYTGSNVVATHVFASAGNYDFAIFADNADGQWGTNAAFITAVNPSSQRTINNGSTTATRAAGSSFSLALNDASAGAGNLQSWVVNWGDGSVTTYPTNQASTSVSHVYAQPGQYTISATAYEAGTGYAADNTVSLSAAAVPATISANGTPIPVDQVTPYTLNLSAAGGSNPITLWTVNWNDGTPVASYSGSNLNSLVGLAHTFAQPGNYLVDITAQDANFNYSTSVGVTVLYNANVSALLQLNDPNNPFNNPVAVAGQTVSLELHSNDPNVNPLDTSDSPTGDTWLVNWGDGTTQTLSITQNDESLQHVYSSPSPAGSQYTISATATINGASYAATPLSLTVGNTAPSVAVTAPSLGYPGTPITVEIGAITSVAAETVSQYTISWGDGSPNTVLTPDQLTAAGGQVAHTYASIGNYPIIVSLVDQNGPENGVGTATAAIVAPPVATISGGPGSLTDSTSATFGVAGTDPTTGAAAVNFEYSIDGGTFVPVVGNTVSLANLADGAHQFQVLVVDSNGNLGPATAYNWSVDTAAPVIAITANPASTAYSGAAQFTFTASDPTRNGFTSGVVQVSYSLDSGSSTVIAGSQATANFTGLAVGSHTFTATATDAAGNVTSTSYAWTIASVTPIVTVTTGGSYTGQPIPAVGTALTPDLTQTIAGTFTYAYYPGSAVTGPGSATASTEAGVYTVVARFTPTDGVDYASASVVQSFIIGEAIPTVSANPVSIAYGTALANGQLSGTATFTFNGVTTTVPGTFSFGSAVGSILQVGANQSVNATFTPTNSTDFAALTTTVSVSVTPASPTVSVNPVNLTYGTALANGQLSGTATWIVGRQTVTVPGTYTYTTGAGTVRTVGNGQTAAVTFTPTDGLDYLPVSTSVVVNVAKATPLPVANPVSITYGTALANGQLSGTATWVVGGSSVTVAGTFSYTAPGTVLTAGNGQTVAGTFTPTATSLYNSAPISITVNVAKATPLPAANAVNLVYGTALANGQLSGMASWTVAGSSVSVPGSFAYNAPGTVLTPGNGQTQSVTFTPTDSADYTTSAATVAVNVVKASPTVTVIPVNFTYGTVLANGQLSGTASWVVGGTTVSVSGTFTYATPGTILDAGNNQSQSVLFTPTQSNLYNAVPTAVSVSVAKANQAISWNTPAVLPYGSALTAAQLNATVSVVGPAPAGALTYNPGLGTILGTPGNVTLTVSAAATNDYNAATDSVTQVVLGPGSMVVGSELWILGANTSDWVQINPVGSSSTGSTGISVTSTLNNAYSSTTYNRAFTLIHIYGYGGSDSIQIGSSTAIPLQIVEGDGSDYVSFGNSNATVSLGAGSDSVFFGSGNVSVTEGNGSDYVSGGNGNVTVTAGSGGDSVVLGNGNDTVTLGDGGDWISLGCGNDAIVAGNGNDGALIGTGNDTVTFGNGNDFVTSVDYGCCSPTPGNFGAVIAMGNGNDGVNLGSGNNTVTFGNGSVSASFGNGNNIVTAGNGSDWVSAGNGNNTVTLGSGNDSISAGNGSNVIVEGNGCDSISAGSGNNLIVAGTGQHTVSAGGGRNIIIDGSASLTNAGDSLRQVLNDWTTYGSATTNISNIRSRLHVTYNTSHANTLYAGGGLDWFWDVFSGDWTNRKSGDLLN